MKKLLYILVMVLLCACSEKPCEKLNIIPQPQKVTMECGTFECEELTLYVPQGAEAMEALVAYVAQSPLQATLCEDERRGQLQLLTDTTLPSEAYRLCVSKRHIRIYASSEVGHFYGVQTLLQCVSSEEGKLCVPCMTVEDAPLFGYRGLHLDVSRHFFSVDFIKKQLDMMARYKLNYFHWHLTDGAGWRLEIKQYPRLTNFAAWRIGAWKPWWQGNRHYCDEGTEGAYGGYYTQDEAREVVAYAKERCITVVPEIEMPGHSDELLAAYPQLSCSGKPYTSGDVCVGNDSTLVFFERVLTEVMDIFPSKYIHIGGDEADKGAWKQCKKCQHRINSLGLDGVNGLQSYFVRHVENFLRENGREMIGWNEIMEGGVSDSAIIMSWTGEMPGIRAARKGNRVVMVPGEYCYFDMYQANPATEPEAIGGYINIEKVYSFNPVYTDSLTVEEQQRIWGVQANLWTEYVPTEAHAERMLYPRLLALAEVGWTKPELRQWTSFKSRVNSHIKQMRAAGYNAFELSDEPRIEQEMLLEEHKVRITMSSEREPISIRFTLDGTEPTAESQLYSEPIELTEAVQLSAALFDGEKRVGPVVQKLYGFHKALGKSLTYNNAGYGAVYSGGGDKALVDGVLGSFSYTDKRWQGFSENDMDVTIDLGEVQPIKMVKATFMQLVGPWVWLPQQVEVLVSDDNQNFTSLVTIENDIPTTQEGLILKEFGFEGETSGRYIRYKAKTCGIKHGWMFVDEIVVM